MTKISLCLHFMISKPLRNKQNRMPHKESETTYFTSKDVSFHNFPSDCWVSINGWVLDVTELVNQEKSEAQFIVSTPEFILLDQKMILPILANAGKDISHWFEKDGSVILFYL